MPLSIFILQPSRLSAASLMGVLVCVCVCVRMCVRVCLYYRPPAPTPLLMPGFWDAQPEPFQAAPTGSLVPLALLDTGRVALQVQAMHW